MKIITMETKNKLNYIFSMWCPLFLIRSLILCLKLPTEVRSFSWGILAHSLRRDVFKVSTLGCTTEETFAFNINHTENPLDSNQAMEEVTSPYSKIFENDAYTSLEFLLRFGMVHHLVGKWNADFWNIFSSLQKLEPKY